MYVLFKRTACIKTALVVAFGLQLRGEYNTMYIFVRHMCSSPPIKTRWKSKWVHRVEQYDLCGFFSFVRTILQQYTIYTKIIFFFFYPSRWACRDREDVRATGFCCTVLVVARIPWIPTKYVFYDTKIENGQLYTAIYGREHESFGSRIGGKIILEIILTSSFSTKF